MKFSTIVFGKYENSGFSMPQLVIKDPRYLAYIVQRKSVYGHLRIQADAVYAAATQVRLPEDKRATHCVQYLFNNAGKLTAVNVVRFADLSRFPANNELRSETLNLLKFTDTVGRILIKKAFRTYWMSGKYLTKKKLEAFFSQQ